MFRNYFLINLLLISIIAFLGVKLYKVYGYRIELPSQANVEDVKKEKAEVDVKRGDRTLNEGVFETISKLDIFRPSRSEPLPEDKKAENALPKDPPKLFGTVILNDNRTAILEDPTTKTTKVYRINDSIAGFTITDILEDRVVLLRDSDKLEVRLRDDKGVSPARRPGVQTVPQRPVPSSRPVPPPQARPVPPRRPATPVPPPPAPPESKHDIQDNQDDTDDEEDEE